MLRLIEKSVCDTNNENKLLWLISVCVSRTGWKYLTFKLMYVHGAG